MSINIPGRVVVFDYGEVISLTPSAADQAVIVEISGCDADPFWAAYWRHREGLDKGTTSIVDYWSLLAADLGASWTASKVHELWVADFRSWFSVEPRTLDLIEELRDGGTRVALLSNAGFDFSGPFRLSPMGRFFERVFVSAEMDAVKPDPGIYVETAAELGIPLEAMVFVDNKSENTDAAAALGVTTHHFMDVEGLDAFLRSLSV